MKNIYCYALWHFLTCHDATQLRNSYPQMLTIYLRIKRPFWKCVEVNFMHTKLCAFSSLTPVKSEQLFYQLAAWSPPPHHFLKLLWKLNRERHSSCKDASFRILPALLQPIWNEKSAHISMELRKAWARAKRHNLSDICVPASYCIKTIRDAQMKVSILLY